MILHYMFFLGLLYLCLFSLANGLSGIINKHERPQRRFFNQKSTVQVTVTLPNKLGLEVHAITKSLWCDENEFPRCRETTISTKDENPALFEGEAIFNRNGLDKLEQIDFSNRRMVFYNEAMNGCTKAQHSYGLLLWNGFGNVHQNAKESAQFHAVAANQNHLDSIAILGGCLRTGSGVPKKEIDLGTALIEFSAEQGNPTGINKKAALYELDAHEDLAFGLLEKSYENGRFNALLLFNLGWYYMNGSDEVKSEEKGLNLWTKAANMAPDEGSEESAWFLYNHYRQDAPLIADKWLCLASNLGYPDAVREYDKLKSIFGEW